MANDSDPFRAIGDPTRREILRLLGDGELSAGELAEQFDSARSTLSHHLAVLKDADLVFCRRDGPTLWYSINTTVMQDVLAWAMNLAARVKATRKSKPRRWTRAAR